MQGSPQAVLHGRPARPKFSNYQMCPLKNVAPVQNRRAPGQKVSKITYDQHKPPFRCALKSHASINLRSIFGINSVQRLVPRSQLFCNGISPAFFSVSEGNLTTFVCAIADRAGMVCAIGLSCRNGLHNLPIVQEYFAQSTDRAGIVCAICRSCRIGLRNLTIVQD